MSLFVQRLLHARGHIVVLLGICAGLALIYGLGLLGPSTSSLESLSIESTVIIDPPNRVALNPDETAWAETAWRYFENNYEPETGLVNSVDTIPSATLWDTGSYLMALIAARRLGIIGAARFDARVDAVLEALATMPLYQNSAPNKFYSTRTGGMLDRSGAPTDRGVGWSAIDIARVLVPLHILVWNHPRHTASARAVLARWRLDNLVREGLLFSARPDSAGRTLYAQEGRLGYEEYAARAFALAGRNTNRAQRVDDFLDFRTIHGIKVPVDSRDAGMFRTHNYVVSEPNIIDGLEFGWDPVAREFAYRIYMAQERRHDETRILTAVSEDNIDQPPYFVYNTVYANGKAWNCITEKGEDAAQFKSISTKAVFGWHVLFRTAYTAMLMEKIAPLNDPDRGWYSGLYETSGKPNTAITCNTNAIVLEALCCRREGPLLRMGR